MKVQPVPPGSLTELRPLNLEEQTPLWYYVLREAEVMAEGKHLGPVGGCIVGEVFIGVLQGDSMSYLCQDPGWTPNFGAVADQFTMVDLLKMAGVVTVL